MLVSNPGTKIASLGDLVAQAKASPGKISYGSPGIGTPHHMSMELLKDRTGASLLHVPYKGSAGAVTDVLGGQIQIMFMPIHVGLQFVKGGKLRALAVGSGKRHPSAPELPTLQELGIRGADVDMWYGFLAPRGTSPAVVGRLDKELRAILDAPELKAAFSAQGMDAASSTPAEFAALMKREDARWGEIVRKNNIRGE
jgi:tripartite-type tricarboxylate transporter receptor subunit TctC